MKLIKGRGMTYTALAVTFLSFAVLIALTIAHQKSEPANPHDNPQRIYIVGQYSVDGGEWTDTVPAEMLNTRFHTVTVRGEFSESMYSTQQLVIIKNAPKAFCLLIF